MDDAALRQAVTLYASFDSRVAADQGGGGLAFNSRQGVPQQPETWKFTSGFNDQVFRIARDRGIRGGALECLDVLEQNGRMYLPGSGNLPYRAGGWEGAVSFWMNCDPDTQLKTGFCDPIQITHRGANNGGIWCDFNDARPRHFRMGTFSAVEPGGKPVAEADPQAPLIRVEKPGFRQGTWHHVVLTWKNFDTGRNDALSVLYVDGKEAGRLSDYTCSMAWDLKQVGIYVGVNFIGLLDELAIFNRHLDASTVAQLADDPALVARLLSTK